MIYLVLTIIQSTLIFVTFKLFNRFRIDNLQAITTNYIVGALFGYVIYDSSCSMCDILEASWLGIAVILGILFIVVFNIFALSSQKVGVALTSVASKMSVVIPVALGFWIYKDRVNTMIIMGLVTALLAFYLTLGRSGDRKVDRRLYILPILLFLGNGTVDSVMKYSQHHYITDDLMLFLVIVFLTAFFIGLSILIASIVKGKVQFRAKHIAAGIILGLLNYGSTYYMIMSMATFDSAVVFPVVNVGIVGLSTLIGFFAFKEQLSWVKWLGILLSLTAILLIAYA
jgi:drug/metabolite transporter (DMT)-like permease